MTSTIAQLTVKTLVDNGINQLYCLPGVQNDHFFDALYDWTDIVKPIHVRHEQSAAYMATGAAMATGLPQAYCVVPGPGFLNTTAALSTAFAVNAPVLALVGQIPLAMLGKHHGLLHEIPDQFGILESLTKSAYQVTGPDDAVSCVQSAFKDLKSGRPRPVGLEIAVNLWTQQLPDCPENLEVIGEPSPPVDSQEIDHALRIINSSQSPMIVVGSGAQDHAPMIQQIATKIGAPVVAFRNGHGIVPSDSPLSIGMPVAHSLWAEVDLVIGLGTRLQSQVLAWGHDSNLKIIHVDVDATQIGRSAPVTLGINASLGDVLPLLQNSVDFQLDPKKSWLEKVAQAKLRRTREYAEKLRPQIAWLQAIRDVLPRNGIFVDELTQNGYVSRFAFESYHPRTFISTGYQGTLGYGFATALGVANSRRDVPVVLISGDGGALFTINELATAVHHRIPLTTVIFNDNAFGNVRRLQMDHYDSRFIAIDLSNPDFVALAESFGAQGLRAETPDQLRKALETGMAHDGPTIIEVSVGELPSPWEFVLMPQVRGTGKSVPF